AHNLPTIWLLRSQRVNQPLMYAEQLGELRSRRNPIVADDGEDLRTAGFSLELQSTGVKHGILGQRPRRPFGVENIETHRFARRFYSRRNVHCIPDGRIVETAFSTHVSHTSQTGVNAYPNVDPLLGPESKGIIGIEPRQGFAHAERGPHSFRF